MCNNHSLKMKYSVAFCAQCTAVGLVFFFNTSLLLETWNFHFIKNLHPSIFPLKIILNLNCEDIGVGQWFDKWTWNWIFHLKTEVLLPCTQKKLHTEGTSMEWRQDFSALTVQESSTKLCSINLIMGVLHHLLTACIKTKISTNTQQTHSWQGNKSSKTDKMFNVSILRSHFLEHTCLFMKSPLKNYVGVPWNILNKTVSNNNKTGGIS